MPEFTSGQLEEFRKLRNLMLVPNSVDVLHSAGGKEIWLCDEFVLVNVTDSPAVDGAHLVDGLYRLQANKGLVLREGEPRVNLARLFAEWRAPEMYHRVHLTGVSVTDDQAKRTIVFALVPYARIADMPRGMGIYDEAGDLRIPLAVNESVLAAFCKLWEDVRLWHAGGVAADGKPGPFRITTEGNAERAYIQPARIPPEMMRIAAAITDVADAERRQDLLTGNSGGEKAAQ